MIAALGETTAGPALPRLRDTMLANPEGRRVLKVRPIVNSQTVDMEKLEKLPEGSFGRAYITWLEKCGVTPDTREPVKWMFHNCLFFLTVETESQVHYIADPELAYVMQRYRECHDFYHCINSLSVNVESELALKFFEFANFGLPVAAISALFGPLRLDSTKRARLFREYVPWALRSGSSAKPLINVFWEERWEQNVVALKQELGLEDPPPAQWGKPLSEAAKAKLRRQSQTESE
jgi:ubiquinone biosynthesis protein COQ4